ncbi:Stk1 family PASTA domain-containing Ser/Thr kinase, partial [Motilibacter deserti]|nr:Stk1 family PASTA domain-containing Ser/Thr kinase [Motilibacter deserti]
MTDTPLLLGGRYQLGELLGHGGMAEVHRALDVRLGRVVAVKMLRPDLARDPAFQTRFRREAQSAASLNHPAIVAVYDTGEDYVSDARIPYIVMELVEGSTLRDLLASGRRLLPERALEITSGVLSALDYSHRHGIVHRDIKPANVMLTPRGDVKVMDFGIARSVAETSATMTQTSAVIGTAQYLSPEQARGEHVDARTDLYSTGCLLFELLTGRPPFTGESPVSVAYQHVREEPPLPSSLDPGIPPAADAVVLKALVKDRDQRYQTAAQMKADVDRARAGGPVEAAPPAPTQALTRVPGPATAPTAVRPTPLVEVEERRELPERSSHSGVYTLVGFLVLLALAGGAYLGWRFWGGGNDVEVPRATNVTVEEASRRLTAAGLVPGQQEPRPDANVREGLVITTDPGVGEKVEKGDTVDLVVSSGPEPRAIPAVQGQSYEDARQALIEAGFALAPRKEEDSEEPEGTVLSVSPNENSLQKPGTEVTLTVSTGRVQVPNVVGQDPQSAIDQLQAAGFKYSLGDDVETTDPNLVGKIVRQVPGGD